MSESSLEEERRKKGKNGSISAEPKTSNQKRWSPHILIKYSPKACLGADGADVANLAEYEEWKEDSGSQPKNLILRIAWILLLSFSGMLKAFQDSDPDQSY